MLQFTHSRLSNCFLLPRVWMEVVTTCSKLKGAFDYFLLKSILLIGQWGPPTMLEAVTRCQRSSGSSPSLPGFTCGRLVGGYLSLPIWWFLKLWGTPKVMDGLSWWLILDDLAVASFWETTFVGRLSTSQSRCPGRQFLVPVRNIGNLVSNGYYECPATVDVCHEAMGSVKHTEGFDHCTYLCNRALSKDRDPKFAGL